MNDKMVQSPDYSTWPTKQEAAAVIGVSTKFIEQLAKEKKMQSAKWKRPETGAWVSVYHPDDVDRLRKERNPDAPPFVLLPASPGDDAPHSPTDITQAVAVRDPATEFLQALAAAVVGPGSQNSGRHSVRIAERLFLTLPEAAEYSGLPQAHLRRLMTDGKLTGVKTGSGWRIRRADLEKL